MNLTHDPADIIRYLLISLGLGTLPTSNGSWPVFSAIEQDSPDNAITTYNTTGKLEGRIQKTGAYVEKPGIQIRVRGTTHAVGYAKGKTIENALDKEVYQSDVTIGGSVYEVHAVSRSGNLIFAGRDSSSSNRFIFTLNVTATIRQLV